MNLAKALGYKSPYGSYWVGLSLINDGVDDRDVETYIKHVESWSKEHPPLKPRLLHLRAELACRSDTVEVIQAIHHNLISRPYNYSIKASWRQNVNQY